MKIYVVGNILVAKDSLPLKLLPELKKDFPQIKFRQIDPNENFTPSLAQPLYIIDTLVGIQKVSIFDNLHFFAKHRSISLHDYDLLFHLHLLKKIHKLPKKVYIIGLPANSNEDQALSEVEKVIEQIIAFKQ